MKSILTVSLAALVVAGCAKSPESIAPAYSSPLAYQPYNCDQLSQESQRVSEALAEVSQQQRDARTNDTMGVIFLGLPVSSLSGGNVADQVAKLKGENNTIRKEMIAKNCAASAIPADVEVSG